MNQTKVEELISELLMAIGEDATRDGLLDTPKRVAKMYAEILSGYEGDPADVLETFFEEETFDDYVLVKDIPFHSLCEHHMAPFFGRAHVAYKPKKGKITGLSKLARLVEGYSRRLQVQERLTAQVADSLMERLEAKGAFVMIEAEHMCMSMRGIKKQGSSTVTIQTRGIFKEDEQLVNRVLQTIKQ